ncbi:MAG: methylated-DNA--[protein]-cysteine S-methyltransferase [Acidobacteriota bacterium]
MPAIQEGSAGPALDSAPQPLRVLLPSPIGPLGVELLGTAVVRLRIDPPKEERSAFTPFHKVGGSDALDEIFGHLSEYFAGARRKLDVEYDLGPCGVSGLAKRVLKEAAKIPYGRTRTHQAIAEALGRPDDYRLVLSALLENPIPILVPCHRVVPAKGVGSYIGGADRKRWLLDMESRPLDDEPL